MNEGKVLPTLDEQKIRGFRHDQRSQVFLHNEVACTEVVLHTILPGLLPLGLENGRNLPEVVNYLHEIEKIAIGNRVVLVQLYL